MSAYRRWGRRWVLPAIATACLATPMATVAGEKLPTLEKWRFKHPIETLHVSNAHDLQAFFAANGYSLKQLHTDPAVPRVYLRRLVDDLHTAEPIHAREALFIRIVLPLVVRANAEILDQRTLLEAIAAARANGQNLAPDRLAWLQELARHYGGDAADLGGLRERVDEIPPSLAIAQAIDESAWGTAPLALQSNGMFGQHAPPGLSRGSLHVSGTSVSVAAFPTLLDGVLAYMTNINRHPAYAALRALRARHRRDGSQPTGFALAKGLAEYSARGMAYVETLRRLIREHKLDAYDTVHLDATGRTILIRAPR